MYIDALLLIQDVQLLCFCVLFGFIALQHRGEPTRFWLWVSFLANAAGAILDFAAPHLPAWLARGVNLEMIPLSYALLNVALVHFVRRWRWTVTLSMGIVLAALPLQLLWSHRTDHVAGDALQDLTIGLVCLVSGAILLASTEKATEMARRLQSAFFFPFAAIEIGRAVLAFGPKLDPDKVWHVQLITAVAYVLSASVLPLAFFWMISSRSEAELSLLNLVDPLTQVLNRRGLRAALDREMLQLEEHGGTLSIAVLDLDSFKQLNDRYGHVSGDAVLAGVAKLLRSTLRGSDTVARLGGEEFVLLLPRTDSRSAAALMERVRIAIEKYEETSSPAGVIRTTISVGLTTTRAGFVGTATELLREADKALYCAKEEGRNQVRVFEKPQTTVN
ncbi:MAG: GGDEF domain-containing protein [Acidobacteriaceae bacterium]|nr:GGDEF domain-containing protein [Acidobacteriaceae bacterium]